MDTRMGILPIIILAALFLMIGLLLAPKYIQDTGANKKELYVNGKAELKVLPDDGTININITNKAKSAKSALELNNKQLAKINDYVDSLKKDYNDIKLETDYFSVNPDYDYDKNTEQYVQVGYIANHSLNLKIPDFNNKGTLLMDSISELVKNDSISISSLYFDVSDELKDSTKKTLLGEAMKDAWAKAKAAGDAGFFVLDTIPAKVNLNYSDYIPRYDYLAESMPKAEGAGSESVEVTPEQVTLSVTVDVTYNYN